jgi:outer membrane protein
MRWLRRFAAAACAASVLLPLVCAADSVSATAPRLAASEEEPRALPVDDGRAVLAIVRDGSSDRFDPIFDLIKGYLQELAGNDYIVDIRQLTPQGFSPDAIRRELRRALNDPQVEVVYTAGMVVTELAALMPHEQRNKPVLGGFPELAEGGTVAISDQGYSTAPNFTFVATPYRVTSDLLMLAHLTQAETQHVIIDSSILMLYPDWNSRAEAMGVKVGTNLVAHAAESSAAEVLASLPSDATAAYVSILPRFSTDELKVLFAGLRDRGIFSLSMSGPRGVELGAAASLASELFDPIARRTAVNLHQLFLGVPTDQLQVFLPNQDQLVINLDTTEAIGWSSDYDTFLSAQFVGGETNVGAPVLTLESAMKQAAAQNAEARAVREGASISRADLRIARGRLLPTIDLNAQHLRSDVSHRSAGSTALDGYATSLGVELQQILFDDTVWSGFRSQGHITAAAELDVRSAALDARAAAGTAFLNFLRARVLADIEKENLRLTENNRRLSRLRVEIGTAEPSEIFRWESEVARGRADVLRRKANAANALIELNRILGARPRTVWSTQPIELADDDYYFMSGAIGELLDHQSDLKPLAAFIQEAAIANSPELAGFDQALEAQGIQLKQRRRAYYVPSVGLSTGYGRNTQGADSIQTTYGNEWSMGVNLNLPLFEGNRRKAEADRQEALIRQLSAQRDLALQLIEQQALSNMNLLRADHANLRLSRRAQAAAQRNYDSVVEKYSNGSATILDSLDAQSGLLQQRQQSASAAYDYLIDVVALQRAISWFEAEQTPAERAKWAERIRAVLRPHAEAESEVAP